MFQFHFHKFRFPIMGGLLAVAALVGLHGSVLAQNGAPPAPSANTTATMAQLDPANIQNQMQTAQAQVATEGNSRQKEADFYKQALEQLGQADAWTSRVLEAETARVQAPALIVSLKQELAAPETTAGQAALPTTATLQELEQMVASPQQELADAQKRASELSTELKRRADRRVEVPRLIAAARQRLEELRTEMVTGPLPDETADITAARMISAQARRQALEREIEAYEKELQSYDARSELLTLQQDEVSRRIARLDKLVREWQNLVNERRRDEAEEAVRVARQKLRAAANAHPTVQQLTEDIAALAERRTGEQGLGAQIERVTQKLQEINASLEVLREQTKSLRSKVDAVGLSDAIGILLRKQREEVMALQRQIRQTGDRRAEISHSHLQVLELEDELAALRDFEVAVQTALASDDAATTSSEMAQAELEATVRELLQQKRTYLQALIKDYNAVFSRLIELDTQETQLRQEATAHASYIDERILWIPSSALFGPSSLKRAITSFGGMFTSSEWSTVGQAFAGDIERLPLYYLLGVLVPLALLFWRRKLWIELPENCRKAGRSGSISFFSIVRASAAVVLITLPAPFILYFFGWRLQASGYGGGLVQAVALGCMGTGFSLLVLEIVRVAAGEGSIAATCFHWKPAALRVVRSNILWLAAIALPILFLVEIAQWYGSEIRDESALRLLFVAGMIPCAIFAHHILFPARAVIGGTFAQNDTGWIYRFRYLWYLLGVGTPAALAVAALVGYQYTALHLGERLVTTIWISLLLIGLNALFVHWLVLGRRKLALEDARRRWQEEQAEAEETESGEMPAKVKQPALDISSITVQANRFLRSSMAFAFIAAMWLIWVDVLPALGILRGYELWSRQVQATETIVNAEGATILQAINKVAPVTLADVLFAIVMIFMTSVAARNLPGLLEITVLQRLNLDNGARYAVATIARYIISIVGGIIALRAVGVGWANVQWMAAAVTVGLGFGLQEIFANFVSGLILLFERPIRAGDVIMVNGILGKVGRIQIRATTIYDMDHKELIIPNKEFITGQVINYTLSDTVIRLTVTVGVAYGSDYDEARRILLRLADEHPIILADPAPIAALSEFKDSSVEFLVFVHLPDLSNFLAVRHDLIASIDREFTKAGIQIPFPQRDLHVKLPTEGLPTLSK